MTAERLVARGVACVLLDIEGTTTPLAFVRDVLFPYARHRLRSFLDAEGETPAASAAVAALAAEYAGDVSSGAAPPRWRGEAADRAGLVAYLEWLMDRDRKSPGLKTLQGLIWEQGYQRRELRGQVYADVPAALRRWHAAQIGVAIYSSGSVLAQRRLFESTAHGDLTPLVKAFFDTAVGPKIDAASYRTIAGRLRLQPPALLFVSDVAGELTAARAAGCQVALSARPGNPPQPDAAQFETVHSL